MYKTISKMASWMALVLCLTAHTSPGVSLAKERFTRHPHSQMPVPLPPPRPTELQNQATYPISEVPERQQITTPIIVAAKGNPLDISASQTWDKGEPSLQPALSCGVLAVILLAVLFAANRRYHTRRQQTVALIASWRLQADSNQTRMAILSETYVRFMQKQKAYISVFTPGEQSAIACEQTRTQMADITRRTYAMISVLQHAERTLTWARWPNTRAFDLADAILRHDDLKLDDSLIPDSASILHGALPQNIVNPDNLLGDYDVRFRAVSTALNDLQQSLDEAKLIRGQLIALLVDLDTLAGKLTELGLTPAADSAYLQLKESAEARSLSLLQDPLKSAPGYPHLQSKYGPITLISSRDKEPEAKHWDKHKAAIQQVCALCDQIKTEANLLLSAQAMLEQRRSQKVQFAYPGAESDQHNSDQLYLLLAEAGYKPDQALEQVDRLLQECRQEIVLGQIDLVTAKINQANNLTREVMERTEQVISAKQLVEANVVPVEEKYQALQRALPEAQNSLQILEAEFLPASFADQSEKVKRALALALNVAKRMELEVKRPYLEQRFCLSLAQLLSLDSEIVDSLKELSTVSTRLDKLQDSRRNARILLGEVDKFAEEVGQKLDQNAATNTVQTVRRMVEALRALAKQKIDVTQDITDWLAAEANALTLALELKTIETLTEEERSACQKAVALTSTADKQPALT